MEGAVYLCNMPSLLGLSIEHSNRRVPKLLPVTTLRGSTGRLPG